MKSPALRRTQDEPSPFIRQRKWRRYAVAAMLLAAIAVSFVVVEASTTGGLGLRSDEPVHLAMVAGLTSDSPETARSMVDSVRMEVDTINRQGGVRGHQIEVEVFDDADDPARARQIAEDIVRADKVVGVIGHVTSAASSAASPVYAVAGIPAITPSATADSLTEGSSWYFRSMFGNNVQITYLSGYIRHVMGAQRASILYGNDLYGTSLHEGFLSTYSPIGTARLEREIDYGEGKLEESIRAAVADVRAQADTGPIVLALQETPAVKVIEALRAADVTAPLVVTDGASTDAALHALRESQFNRGNPGLLFKDLYLVAPLINDALTGAALKWAQAFTDTFHYSPSWCGAASADAVKLLHHAVEQPAMTLDHGGRVADRARIRETFHNLNQAESAVPGLLGPLYFDPTRSIPHPIAVATTDGDQFISAPVQLAPYAAVAELSLADEIAAGTAINVRGTNVVRRQVVSTGISVNQIRDLDTQAGTFFADFFLWLKYTGDDAAGRVSFANSDRPELVPEKPVRMHKSGDRTYLLYRVAGEFKVNLEFMDFPFDEQKLRITLQNSKLPSSRVVYVTDKEILQQRDENLFRSGVKPFEGVNDLSNWFALSVHYYQATTGTTAPLGDPTVATGIDYSQYAVEVTIHRDVSAFLVKNLLPLALLAVVTYLSLFLIPTELPSIISIGVGSIVSTTILLDSVTSKLPDVSYTVALEWGYYAFALLAVASVFVSIMRWRFFTEEATTALQGITVTARVVYPIYLLVIVGWYIIVYV